MAAVIDTTDKTLEYKFNDIDIKPSNLIINR